MVTLTNVLKFIDLLDLSIRSFEAECGLSNGTITGSKNREVDLSIDNINKIVERYSTELSAKGFYVVDLTAFGKGKAILNSEEKKNLQGPLVNKETQPNPITKSIELKTASGKKVIIVPEGETEFQLLNAFLEERDKRIDDLIKDKDDLLKLLNSGLGDISKVQKAVFAMVRTGLEYEAAVASRGDKKKEAELLSSLTKLNNKNLKVDASEDSSIVLRK
jgi:hypothetical protein